ncbi:MULTISPECIES: hypothetical protein [Tessaracoccus]|uniref:hypothetical protein n=1 Tax=Tessaracoccus TaxID=72763 RepID=UPI00099CA8E9|nr:MULTISPECIES: hypothetical protein [Tessaracoccus]AQX16167.1 hypothetical protein BKM78_09790 [Tessaracoccus sp. T2.5-30]
MSDVMTRIRGFARLPWCCRPPAAPSGLGVVDAPDYWPWPSGGDPSAERCYAVAAVSTTGLEGPMSPVACATPL